jgi:xylose isomerase
MVLGKRMEEHLRFAVCYWHTFCWNGLDPFGGDTFQRPWHSMTDPMAAAKAKAEVAFEFFSKLGAPYYCFHDRDVAPEGATPRDSVNNLREMVDILGAKQQATGMKLLWGTANLFSHRRFMSGAATNPNPEIFAMGALQVKEAMDATLKLGGENYVLWGGREGYETLLNTRMGHELDQMGRFLNMVVEYKHKIGFKGTILLEPKPREPSKHQYDFDTATVYGLNPANPPSTSTTLTPPPSTASCAATAWRRKSRSISKPTTPPCRATALSTKLPRRLTWASSAPST